MARISKYEGYKNNILAQFELGKEPKDIYTEFAEVPGSTIRDWYKKFIAETDARNSAQIPQKSAPISEKGLRIVPPPPQQAEVIPFREDYKESDLAFIRRRLREIANHNDATMGVQVQALTALMKAGELIRLGRLAEAKPTLDLEFDVEEIPDDDLMERYQELLVNGANSG